jgi:hypothetical protein
MAGDRAPGLLCGDDDVAPAVIDRKAIGFRSYTRHKKKKKKRARVLVVIYPAVQYLIYIPAFPAKSSSLNIARLFSFIFSFCQSN